MGKASPPEFGIVSNPNFNCRKQIEYPKSKPKNIPLPEIKSPSKKKILKINFFSLVSNCYANYL